MIILKTRQNNLVFLVREIRKIGLYRVMPPKFDKIIVQLILGNG